MHFINSTPKPRLFLNGHVFIRKVDDKIMEGIRYQYRIGALYRCNSGCKRFHLYAMVVNANSLESDVFLEIRRKKGDDFEKESWPMLFFYFANQKMAYYKENEIQVRIDKYERLLEY